MNRLDKAEILPTSICFFFWDSMSKCSIDSIKKEKEGYK